MATAQWVLGYAGGANSGAVRYGLVLGNANNAGSFVTAEAAAQIPWAAAGQFKTATITIDAAPGTSRSWRFQLMVNGLASLIDITIAGTAVTGTATFDIAISPGDLVDWQCTPTNTPNAVAHVELWLKWLPTTANEYVYGGVFGQGGTLSAAAVFNPLFHSFSQTTLTTENLAKSTSLAPIAGQITTWYVRLDAAPTSTNSWDFSLRNNLADIGSLLNITGVATTGSQTGLTHNIAVGDNLAFHIVNRNGTPTASRVAWSVVFKPTNTGQFCWTGSDETNNTSAHFWMVEGGGSPHNSDDATEALVQVAAPGPLLLSALIYRSLNAPGTQKQWAVSTRIAGVTGNLTIASGNTTGGSDTSHSDSVAVGQLINIALAVTGAGTGPSGMGVHAWSVGVGIPPSTDTNTGTVSIWGAWLEWTP